MAYSTQKEFFVVPFMNETVDFECSELCVKLKSYPSTNDDRSWAADENKKSRFVADLVSCNIPVVQGQKPGAGRQGPAQGAPGRGGGQGQGQGVQGPSRGASFGGSPGRGSTEDPMMGDSLINAAGDTIENMKSIMIKNNLLEKKLADSNDRLVNAKLQNDEIKRIMNDRYDPEQSKRLKDKIQQLSNSGKIDPNDAKELNDIQKSIDDMNKAHDILEVENANLRRLIEKQSRRIPMDSIKIDPEKSNDVNYLQNKINNMGKELTLLREAEDYFVRTCGAAGQGGSPNGVEMDINAIQNMLAERDALRRKIKALGVLENKVNRLQETADKANNCSCDLVNNLNSQNQYINDMECDMQEMQRHYEKEIDKSKYKEEVLKCRCRDMQQQVMALQPAVRRCECQQNEIDVLRNELLKRDMALKAYDCQYQQLMGVICELNQKYGNQRGDCPAFTVPECPNIGDDLAFYTGATLEHIMHELCKQADCFKQMNQSQQSGDPKISNIQDCTQELERLRLLLKEKDGELDSLIEENECMCEAALESNQRLNQLDEKVKELDKDTKYMEEGMRQSIDLIQDIGDVARQNEQLKDKVANMRQSQLQQLTDDLRKQLEDCMKSKQESEEANRIFRQALKDLGVNPDELLKKKLAEEAAAKAAASAGSAGAAGSDEKAGDKPAEAPASDAKAEEKPVAPPASDAKAEEKPVEPPAPPAKAEEKPAAPPAAPASAAKAEEKPGAASGAKDGGKSGAGESGEGGAGGKGKGDGAAGKGDGAAGKGDGAAGKGDGAAGKGDGTAGKGDGAGGRGSGRQGMKGSKVIDDTTEEQFDQFVKNTVKTLSAGEIDGVGLERELRKILDMFIDECGFCFCKCNIPKSRFYAICHKLYHHGLHTLDFKDLAYMHKRIFAAAENILPGCLFNMIMKDFIAINPQTMKSAACPPKTENQCCTCKSALCCDDTEEKLIVKVMRLENDIENAKQCLKNLKSIPSDISIHDYRMEAGDCVPLERVVRSPREKNSIAIYKQIKQTRRIKKAFASKN